MLNYSVAELRKIIYYTDDTNHVVHIMAIWDCRRDIVSMKDLLSR